MTLRIAIADDHEMIRVGLERIVSGLLNMQVIAQFADAHQLLSTDLQAVDLLLLDLNMPGPDGVSCIITLATRYPNLKTVVFSMLPEESFAPRVLAAGARAFLSKNASPEEVIEAIETVAEGRRYIPESQQEILAVLESEEHDALPHQSLTRREFEILLQVAGGSKPTEVADRLGLRMGTVTTHIHRLKRKLGAHSLGDLVAYAHRHRLLGY